MTTELTNEEIARVFGMYYGSGARHKDAGGNDDMYYVLSTVMDSDRIENYLRQYKWDEWKLFLTPLQDITDEHAIEVYKIFGITEDEAGFDTSVKAIKNCCIKDGFHALSLFDFYGNISDVFQYLIQKGYSVPLFFGVNHPCNGKTAIELGLAINNTNKQS